VEGSRAGVTAGVIINFEMIYYKIILGVWFGWYELKREQVT